MVNVSQYLKLANDRILEDCQAGATDDSLWLFLQGLTMQEAAQIAFDTEALQRIEFHYGTLHNTFEGYTELKAITSRGSQIEVVLQGGQWTEVNQRDEANDPENGADGLPDGSGDASGDVPGEQPE
jgi:hypothetical protein